MSGKILQDLTVPYKPGIFIPGVDMSLAVGSRNIKLLASSITQSQYTTPQQFGAIGNGLVDDTIALQAAIDAGIANQTPVYIPSGRYLISAPLLVRRGVHIFGTYVEPQTQMFTPANSGGNGTWLVLDATHLVSAFYINPTGTPSNANQAMGIEIDHIGIYHAQPAPGAGWTPRAYPPAIDIPAGSDVYLHDLVLLNPTKGIQAAGQSAGRLRIERICGQPLTNGIILDNQHDVVTVRDVHFWVYWSEDTSVLTWQKANGFGITLGALDLPVIDNFTCLWYWVGAEIRATTNGFLNVGRFTNCDFDECANPVMIDDPSGSNTVLMSGCSLFCDPANTTTSSLTIQGGGANTAVSLTGCYLGEAGHSCVSITSGGNHVRLAGCHCHEWDRANTGNSCLNAGTSSVIRADAETITFSTLSPTRIMAGGQCLKAPAFWLSKGVMASGATSNAVAHLLNSVPDMMLVTPNGALGSATQWWATADTVNVTVHVNTAPGVNVPYSVLLGDIN